MLKFLYTVWSQTSGLIFYGLTIEAAAVEIIPKYALKMHFFFPPNKLDVSVC